MNVEIRPAFDEAVMAAELPVREAAAKVLLLLQTLNLPQLWSHPGLNFEKLQGMIEPATGQQLYSYELKVCNPACDAAPLVTDAKRCANGYGYSAAAGCCWPISTVETGCVIYKVDIGACLQ